MNPLKPITRSAIRIPALPARRKTNILPLSSAILLLSVFMFIFPGCNPEEWEVVDCYECYTDRPAEAEINVKLSLNDVNRFVVIDIYSGRIEEEILLLSDTARSEYWSAVLPADAYYTVTATYRSGSQARTYYNVTAIDGNFVRTEKVSNRCDQPCWVIRGNNFNVKLKY
ncbi:MAG: hypothetical protein R6U58_08055 [Bacteroidales bacterium]